MKPWFWMGREMLRTLNYRVITVPNGAAAIDLYRREQSVDLVILDMVMPDMNGSEVFDAIRRSTWRQGFYCPAATA